MSVLRIVLIVAAILLGLLALLSVNIGGFKEVEELALGLICAAVAELI